MFKNFTLKTTTILTSSVLASGAFAEQGATEILEEYFANFENGPLSVTVGDKDDAGRYTQWNNVILSGVNDKFQVAVPFVRVDKAMLGGYTLSYSPVVKGAFQSPEPDVVEPVEFVIQTGDMEIAVGGAAGSRSYDSKVGSFSFTTMPHPAINIAVAATNGTSSQSFTDAGYPRMAGQFDFETMTVNFKLNIDNDELSADMRLNGMAGSFDFPVITDVDPSDPMSQFDPTRDLNMSYAIKSGGVTSSVSSPAGPVHFEGQFGRGTGTFGMKDSVLLIQGDTYDVAYNVDATTMGLPPIDFAMKRAVANMSVPIENVGIAKPARYKVALEDLTVSDGVWAMIDPNRVLPRDPISLDIDLGAKIRWLRSMKDMANLGANEAPIEAETAEITALYLKGAGAEIDAKGSFTFDNSVFPPKPDGRVEASVKGSSALIEKLAQIGLIPPQSVMMAKGMTAMFFVPGTGADHLTTVLEFTKDGGITANGMRVK